MAHHEPFKALAPLDWSTVDRDGLSDFLGSTFASAQTLIDSIPLPAAITNAQRVGRRTRAHTEGAVAAASVEMNRALAAGQIQPSSVEHAAALQKEWKEVKINPRDNPLDINVYRLGARDGKGAWFARRSIHEGMSFAHFRLGLEREFAEALKVSGAPGSGNVRGIGAEKRVEREVAKGAGKAEVYLLSAQFPGPTTPRDFVTLLLSSAGEEDEGKVKTKKRAPRQFMVVSKPCIHPECEPRSGFIRGQYESVEIIREVPIDKPLRRTRSSIDISTEEAGPLREETEQLAREAILRSAQKVAEATEKKKTRRGRGQSISASFDARSEVGLVEEEEEEQEVAVEWLMVTRSDPGGSVPRFMVEKGTPSGIVSDAGKLLKWLDSKSAKDFVGEDDNDFKEEAIAAEEAEGRRKENQKPSGQVGSPSKNLVPDDGAQDANIAPSGFYGMIAGALGAAGSIVISHLPNNPLGSTKATDSEPDAESDSDASSFHSFDSVIESAPGQDATSVEAPTPDMSSLHSVKSTESKPASLAPTQSEKELKKLEDRRRKIQEKITKMQERASARQGQDKEKDLQALQKLKEKHERDMAKQEERYQRELQKLEQKRQQEQKKAEERRKKQIEREEKANVSLELERVKSERDVALKQIEVLKEQIGALQSQNTQLVAKLGRNGLLKEEDFRKDVSGEKKMAAVQS
jgi:hypothetical protein